MIRVRWPFADVTAAAVRATRALRRSPRQKQETERGKTMKQHTMHNADKGGPK